MKTATATITVKVKFEFDGRNNKSLRELAETAMDLAVEPNTHTIEEGVQILDYERCLDDYKILYE